MGGRSPLLVGDEFFEVGIFRAAATANVDVTLPGARRGNFAGVSLDACSISFVPDCHLWSNNSVRVTARNVSASTVDLAAAPLAVQLTKRRVP